MDILGIDDSRFQDVLDGMTEEEMERAVAVNAQREREYREAGIITGFFFFLALSNFLPFPFSSISMSSVCQMILLVRMILMKMSFSYQICSQVGLQCQRRRILPTIPQVRTIISLPSSFVFIYFLVLYWFRH